MDMSMLFSKILNPLIDFVLGVLGSVFVFVFVVLFVFLITFFIRMKSLGIKFRHLNLSVFANKRLGFAPYNLLRWLLYDLYTLKERRKIFREYGFSIFVGRQGSGKTISMVHYLEKLRKKNPDLIIITNFKYKHASKVMTSWRDFLETRNGGKGVVFAIDEIHSEYNADAWKDFPESLLSEISQQRKQRIKIVATAQVFNRIAKPIREQTFSVITCKTIFGRLTFTKEYDAAEYAVSDTPYRVKKRCRPISKSCFVQSNHLRDKYDTYEKIKRMEKLKFIPRHERF